MMKLHAAMSAGLATFLVAPAALRGDELATLEAALAATDRAIDVVTGVAQQAQTGSQEAEDLIPRVTEVPILDPHGRDQRLASLRGEVNLLRTELDQLEMKAVQSGALPLPEPLEVAAPHVPLLAPPIATNQTSLKSVTTGFDDATRAALEKARLEAMARASGNNSSDENDPSHAGPGSSAKIDGSGYSADPVREARACYHAGRYEDGLALLQEAKGEEGLFWRSRISEHLDKLDSAESDLRELLSMNPDSRFASRAQDDLDFIAWKREFQKRMGAQR